MSEPQKRGRGRPRKKPKTADEILQDLKAKKKPAVLAVDSQPSMRETQNSDDETSPTPHFDSIPNETIGFPRQKQIPGNHVSKSTANDNNKSHTQSKPNKTSPIKDKKSNQNKKDEINLVDDEPSDDEIIRDSLAPMDDEEKHMEWIGEPIATINNKKYYRKFKLDHNEYKLFDFVTVNMIEHPPPHFGQILLMWQENSTHFLSDPLDRSHNKKMLCKCYVRPEDTKIGKKPCFGEMELFGSHQVKEFLVVNTQGRCTIETFAQYKMRSDFPHDAFFFREMYDPTSGKFSQTTPNDEPTPTALRNALPKDVLDIMFKLKILESPSELKNSDEHSPSSSSSSEKAPVKSPKRKRRVVDDESDDGEAMSSKSHSETDTKPNGKTKQPANNNKKTSTSIQLFNEGMDEDTKGSLDLDLSPGVVSQAPALKRLKKPEPEANTKVSNNNNKKASVEMDLFEEEEPKLKSKSNNKTSAKNNNNTSKATLDVDQPTVLAYDSQEESQPKHNELARKSPRITQAAKKREEKKQQHLEGLHRINKQLFKSDEEEEDEDKSEAEEIVPDTNNNNRMEEDEPVSSTTNATSQPKYASSKFAKTTSSHSEQKSSNSKATMIDLAESDQEEDQPASRTTIASLVQTPSKSSSSSSSKIFKAHDFSYDDDDAKKSLGGLRKPLSLSLTSGASKLAATQSRLTELFKIGQPGPSNFFSSATKVQSPRKSLEIVSSPPSNSSAASFNPKKKIFLSNYEDNQHDERKHDPDLGIIEPVSFSTSDINSVSFSSNLSNQSKLGGTQRAGGLGQLNVTSMLTGSSSSNNNATSQKKGLQLKPKTVVNLEDELDEVQVSSPPKSKYSYSASTEPGIDEIEVDDEDIQREKKQKALEERLKASAAASSRKHKKKKTVHSNGSFIPELFVTNNPQDVGSDDERQHLKAQQRAHRNKPASDFDEQPTRRYAVKKSNRPLDKEYESDRSQESEDDSDLEDFIVHDTTDPTMNSLDEALQDISPSAGAKRRVQDDDEEEIISVISKDKVRRPASPEPTLDNFTADYSLKDAFGVYIQYIISCNLDETFPESILSTKSETYFRPAIKKVQGALEGRKELMLRSTAWNEQFKDDLECYPHYSSWQSSRQNHRDCEACLRSQHHATFEVRLSGTKYDAKKVWQGLVLPPAVDEGPESSKDYVLGKFCHARTQLFHEMHHYKIHLFHRVEKKLESVSSDATSDEVVELLLNDDTWMEQLYTEFRKLIQEADDFGRDGMTET